MVDLTEELPRRNAIDDGHVNPQITALLLLLFVGEIVPVFLLQASERLNACFDGCLIQQACMFRGPVGDLQRAEPLHVFVVES